CDLAIMCIMESFFFKQNTAYEIETSLEFRRVLFRSFSLVLAPSRVSGILRFICELGISHRGSQASEHCVLIGCDDEPLSVCGWVDVARGDLGKRRSTALALNSVFRPFRHQRLHHSQHRFVNSRIHNLAESAVVPFLKSGQDTHRTE